jgi:hypothetical protein
MVDLDASFSQEFVEIPVGQSLPQVPPDGDNDHLRRESVSGEHRAGPVNLASRAITLHPGSLLLPETRARIPYQLSGDRFNATVPS